MPQAKSSCCPAADVRVERAAGGDLDLVRVANDELVLSFLPQVGGRLISLQVSGSELLWRNPAWLRDDLSPVTPHRHWPATDGTMGSWANVGGSKTWPAPQGWDGPDEWAGPPDPVLDAGSYAVSVDESSSDGVRVTLASADDPRTGVRISREFLVPPTGSGFTHTATLTNISDRCVRWSAWEVTQVATELGGEIVVDVSDDDAPVQLLVAQGTPQSETFAGRTHVQMQDVVAKLGFPHATGRLAWRRSDGGGLVQEMRREAEAHYPDGGCPVELWLQHPLEAPLEQLDGLHPGAYLVELETLSPVTLLEPGESVRHEVTWRCSAPFTPGEVPGAQAGAHQGR